MSRWELFFMFILTALVTMFVIKAYEQRLICNQLGGVYFSGDCYEAKKLKTN